NPTIFPEKYDVDDSDSSRNGGRQPRSRGIGTIRQPRASDACRMKWFFCIVTECCLIGHIQHHCKDRKIQRYISAAHPIFCFAAI
ncbi:hypothetical protein, partial [Sphingomonas sp. S-NIH.Pt1_0416]|uniref:hypothetical protein n=1 Tax=Sphingomonas sp. S-NIH.Pt1_0416 TaxID=1920123 RepID=UPI0019CFFE44